MRYVKFFGLFITFILIFGVTDAQNAKNTQETPSNKTQLDKEQKSDKYLKKVTELTNKIQNACDKAIADGNSNTLYLILSAYKQKIKEYPELKPLIKKYFEKYVKIRETEIDCIEDNELKIDLLCKLSNACIDIVNNHKMAEKLVLQAIELSDDFEKIDEMYKSIGYVKYILPEGNCWDEILTLSVCRDKLDIILDSEFCWVTKKKLNELKLIEQEILRVYEKLKIEFKKSPFLYEVYKTKSRLRANPMFLGFELEFIPAQPFIFVIVKDDDEEINAKRKRYIFDQIPLFQQYWKQIKEGWIDRLKLKSNLKNDSTENPRAFTITLFRSRNELELIMKAVEKVHLADYEKAYFSPYKKITYSYLSNDNSNEQEEKNTDLAFIIHELTIQILDRYASPEDGLKGVHSIFITEGFSEYMHGCEKDEKTGDYKFGTINYKPRMQVFGYLKQLFGHRDSYVYDNLKNEENLPFMPPREDWNVVPIESLLVSCIRGVAFWYGHNLAYLYRTGFLKAYNDSDPKDSKIINRAVLLSRFHGGPGVFIYGTMYATSWAFTHFLIEKYPKQYNKIFKEVLSGKPLPQAFSKAFELSLNLPDIEEYLESKERLESNVKKLTEALIKQIKMLQENRKLMNIERAFHTWLYKKYEEVMGKPIYGKENDDQPQTKPQTQPDHK